MRWHDLKSPIVSFLDLSYDAAHIHFGLVVFFLVLLLIRRHSRRLLLAWASVLVIQIMNELLDYHDWRRWGGGWSLNRSLIDCFNTMLWPSVIVLTARWWGPLARDGTRPDRDPEER